MKLLDSFVQRVSLLNEVQLEEWISDGLAAYHDKNSGKFGHADAAFNWASLSFGRDGYYSTAVSDLTKLFRALGGSERNRFSRALSRSIDLVSITDEVTLRVLRDQIELALEIKSAHSVDAVARKVCILDAQARDKICIEAAFLLSESHAAVETLKLAKTILDRTEFPYEISARLLIALCTHDIESAATYAMTMRPKLEQQMSVLRRHPEQYERFRSDFAAVILRAPNESETVAKLLRQPVYAQLLEGKLERLRDTVELSELAEPVELVPVHSLQIVRRWLASWVDMCSLARSHLGPSRRRLRVEDTLDAIDRAIAG